MIDWIQREFVYLSYYMELQTYQLLPFYIFGTLLGSAISVFIKDRLTSTLNTVRWSALGFVGFILAALLGFASPICMYGTLPLVAALHQKGVRQDYLACFISNLGSGV